MNEFQTELELAGETRQARVTFEEVFGDIYMERVEIALDVNETYTSLGIYSPRTERRWLDITNILSDRQALELTREIKEAMRARAAEDYDDGRMQDWEERQRNVPA